MSRFVSAIVVLIDGARTLGRHFAAALAMSERMAAPPWAAHARFAWAEIQMQRGDPGDNERALDLNDQTLTAAEPMGMTRLANLALKVRVQGIRHA